MPRDAGARGRPGKDGQSRMVHQHETEYSASPSGALLLRRRPPQLRAAVLVLHGGRAPATPAPGSFPCSGWTQSCGRSPPRCRTRTAWQPGFAAISAAGTADMPTPTGHPPGAEQTRQPDRPRSRGAARPLDGRPGSPARRRPAAGARRGRAWHRGGRGTSRSGTRRADTSSSCTANGGSRARPPSRGRRSGRRTRACWRSSPSSPPPPRALLRRPRSRRSPRQRRGLRPW